MVDWNWNITTPNVVQHMTIDLSKKHMTIDKSSSELLFMNFAKIEIVMCLIGSL